MRSLKESILDGSTNVVTAATNAAESFIKEHSPMGEIPGELEWVGEYNNERVYSNAHYNYITISYDENRLIVFWPSLKNGEAEGWAYVYDIYPEEPRYSKTRWSAFGPYDKFGWGKKPNIRTNGDFYKYVLSDWDETMQESATIPEIRSLRVPIQAEKIVKDYIKTFKH